MDEPRDAKTSVKAGCCGDADLSKLGRCSKCLWWALLLTLMSWSGFFWIRHVWRQPWLLAVMAIYASLFSLLFVAHVIARVRKAKA